MSDFHHPPADGSPPKTPNTPWRERIVYDPRAGGYARRPDRLNCLREDAYKRAFALARPDEDVPQDPPFIGWGDEKVFPLDFDEATSDWSVEALVDKLDEEQFPSEPDYVLFANPMYANPMYANPMYANPMHANPMHANPMHANPMHANPMHANPMYANPVYSSPVYASPVFSNPMHANAYICDGLRPSTARPTEAPQREWEPYKKPGKSAASVVVFDTGIAAHKYAQPGGGNVDFCPTMLTALSAANPDQWEIPDNDPPDEEGEGYIDPVSGHGTFIAGIVQSLAPGTKILPRNIVSSYGDVSVTTVFEHVVDLRDKGMLGPHHIVNMSFGGYADEKMSTLQRAVRMIRSTGAVVVASAGNDATDRPAFPACLSDVVGVGALDPYGPAPYSNFGGWVNACAPGTDLVSAFYQNFDGKTELPEMPGSADPDEYLSWVRWTGTSFAAPMVTAALVREMQLSKCTAEEAVARVIDAPGLLRIAGFGTVVNLDLGDPTCLMPGGPSSP